MEKKYEVKTLTQVCNIVNNENIEDLSICFVKWLFSYNAAISEIREKHPELTDGKLNTEIVEGYFEWIDDGKTDILSHGIINGDTGEVIESKLKDKKQQQ